MNLIDLTDQRFGRWTVLERGPNKGRKVRWLCRCDCGSEQLVASTNLTNGKSRSCGCLHSDTITTHNMTGTPEHRTWLAIKSRCCTTSNIGYKYYGGKGIKVCDRWIDSFENFFADMGNRPEGHSIDRIDPNGDYEPNNCRWATREIQDNNRRGSTLLTHDGRTMTVSQWARDTGINKSTILNRLNWGWPIEDALTWHPDRNTINPHSVKPST